MGYASKGGKKKVLVRESMDDRGYYTNSSRSIDYLHFNTSFRVKYPVKSYSFYVGIGPKVDFLMSKDVLLGHEIFNEHYGIAGYIKRENPAPPLPGSYEDLYNMELAWFENYTFNRVLFGFKPEIGFDYYFADRFMLGFNVSYHINTDNVGKYRYMKLENHESVQKDLRGKTLLFMLTFGYKL